MKINFYHPTSALKPFVKLYIEVEFDNHGQRWWIPADLRNQLFIVHRGKPRVETVKEAYYHDYLAVRGCFDQPLAVSFGSEKVQALVIEFTPIGLNQIFGIEGQEVKNAFVPLETLIDEKQFSEFKETISNKTDVGLTVEALNKHLEEKINTAKPLNRAFLDALNLVFQAKGDIKTVELAEKVDVNERTLLRYFKKYTGLSTKEYLNQIRFQEACKVILKSTDSPENKLKTILGFYDQSHMINSFSKYAGTSPGKIDELDAGWVQLLLQKDIY